MDRQIWVIDHKATLSNFSPMNIDGSTWILGICVLSADSQEDAQKEFNAFLKDEQMELLEAYELSKFDPKHFEDDSRRSNQIKNAARTVSQDGETCYVYARTSEALSEGAESDN